jgi:5-hydroxyisourate hydrolase
MTRNTTEITTHILDTSRGQPAAGLSVSLAMHAGAGWTEVAAAAADADGRVANLLPTGVTRAAGVYRLRFETADYFGRRGTATFYPHVDVVFTVDDEGHYHVPLLLSPFGYATYRGR